MNPRYWLRSWLPKPLEVDAVFIDDDPDIRKVWALWARRQGVRLALFQGPREFFAQCKGISRSVPVYCDLHFEPNEMATQEIVRIHQLGYEVVVCTWLCADLCPELPFLRFRGKTPPDFSAPAKAS